MALSYFAESAAPRDFRVESTESDGHYKKCVLCYTVKRNFFCPECVRAGNFIHSSMPYSDRFAEKQAKLLRLKSNRRHVLDVSEKLLSHKVKRDSLLTEAKQSRDRIDLLRLAIEQRRSNIVERKKQLTDLVNYNNELRLKLPRYQKRVSSLGKHAHSQRLELHSLLGAHHDQTQALAALRRSRIRQLTKYIFPIYITYDSSDSIEDLEFVGCDAAEAAPPARAQLHVVAPWISADCDQQHVHAWVSARPDPSCPPHLSPLPRSLAALALLAQLTALLAAVLDVRLPHALPLSEFATTRATASSVWWRLSRVLSGAAALCARSGLPPPAPPAAPAPLAGLDALCLAAAADASSLGRVEAWTEDVPSAWEACAAAVAAEPDPDDAEPPEHLHWPEPSEMEDLSSSPPAPPAPPAPAASLVTSAAASLVSMWRGWTK